MKQSYQWIRQMALKAFGKEFIIWLGIFCFLFGVGKSLDFVVFDWFLPWRGHWIDNFMINITEEFFYVVVIALGLTMIWRICQNPNHRSQLVPAVFAIFITVVVAIVLKSVFRIPRPFMTMGIEALVMGPSYSFPSAHTAAAFALVLPFLRISKIVGAFWIAFALLIGFARIYQGVHYPSDVAAGIFLGGVIGSFFSNPDIQKWLLQKWEQREFRRQNFHLFIGFMSVFFHWAGLLRLRFLGGLLLLGLGLSLLSQYHRIPIISYCLERFDRPRDKNFPGRGAFYFLLSVFLCFLIFNGPLISIAYSAILILAVGDSLNHLIAPAEKDKEPSVPWNRKRTYLGILIGILAGTLAAQFFVPLQSALIASSLALIVESFPIKIGKYYLDDNLSVPLIAGFTIYCLEYGFDFGNLFGSLF